MHAKHKMNCKINMIIIVVSVVVPLTRFYFTETIACLNHTKHQLRSSLNSEKRVLSKLKGLIMYASMNVESVFSGQCFLREQTDEHKVCFVLLFLYLQYFFLKSTVNCQFHCLQIASQELK